MAAYSMIALGVAILVFSSSLANLSVLADLDGGPCSGLTSRRYNVTCSVETGEWDALNAHATANDWFAAALQAHPARDADYGCSPPLNQFWEAAAVGRIGSGGNINFYHELEAQADGFNPVVANVFIDVTDNAMAFVNYWPKVSSGTWQCSCDAV